MASSIADLSIDISTNIAKVVVEFQRAAAGITAQLKSVETAVAGIQSSIEQGLVGSFKSLAGAVTLGYAIHQVVEFGKATVESAEKIGDLATATGSSVESISKLANQAAIAGTNFEQFQGFLFKMTKSMSESKQSASDAARALQFLGVSAEDPAEALQQVIRAMSQYEDGIGKMALATALFGKSGQEFLDTLNDMAKLGDVQATVTAKQAEEAEKLAQAIRRWQVESTALRDVILSDIVPAMNTWIQQFIALREAGGTWFAFLHANTNALGIADQIAGLDKQILKLTADIDQARKSRDRNSAYVFFDPAQLRALEEQLDRLEKKRAAFAKLRDMDRPLDTAGDTTAGRTRGDAGFRTREKDKAAIDGVAKALESMEDRLRSTIAAENNLSEVDKVILALQEGKIDGLTKEHKARLDTIFGLAQEVDLLKARAALFKDEVGRMKDEAEAEAKARKEALDLSIKVAQARNREFDDFFEQEERKQKALNDSIRAFRESIEWQEQEVKMLGMDNTERAKSIALWQAQRDGIDTTTASFKAWLDRLGEAVTTRDVFADTFHAWRYALEDITRAGSDFIVDFVEHGSSAFRRLWDNFKHWALTTLAQIAARQIVVSITGAIGLTGAAGAAANAFGASPTGTIADLFGIGSTALGGAGSAFAQGFFHPFSTAAELLTGGFAEFATPALALATSLGAAIPIIGGALAAASLLGIFNKEPSQVRGQFRISPSTGGFEDNAFTSSRFGNIGFADAGTQYFGGQAAQVFNKIVAGAIDAFASRYSDEQSARFAEMLQRMTFQAFEGTYTTEDFIKTYGGAVLQQIITAAFDELDPALGGIAAKFSGTADEIANFGNTLLSIYDASSKFSDDFRANIAGALGDATQETASKVLAFVQIVATFGESLTGLGAQFEALAAESIPAVIDALGGAQNAAQAFAYLQTNFLTDAERVATQQTRLADTFSRLGEAIPETHQQFLALLSSLDLNTDAGRQAYVQLLSVADAFIVVNGTAQDAASAIGDVADSAQRVADAMTYFNEHFYSDTERATQRATAGWTAVHDAWTTFGLELLQMGHDHIPTTREAFRSLIEGIDRTSESGRQLYDGLIVLAPGIDDINTAVELLGTTSQDAGDMIAEAARTIQYASDQAAGILDSVSARVDAISGLAGSDRLDVLTARSEAFITQMRRLQDEITAIWAAGQWQSIDFGRLATLQTSLDQLKPQYNAIVADMARLVTLRAQYGDAIGDQLFDLEQQRDQVSGLFRTTEELALYQRYFDQRWQAIIDGTASGVDKTLDQLARLKQGIAEYLQGLVVGDLSPFSPKERFAESQRQFRESFAAASGGDLEALGNITKLADQYRKLSLEVFASSAPGREVFEEIVRDLQQLSTTTTDDPNQVVASAMPTGSPVASQADIRALQDGVTDLTATVDALLRRIAENTRDGADAASDTVAALATAGNAPNLR